MCSTQAAEALSFGNGESPSSPKMAKDDSHGALEKVGSEQACLPSLELLVVHLKRKTGQSELSPARKSKASVPKCALLTALLDPSSPASSEKMMMTMMAMMLMMMITMKIISWPKIGPKMALNSA